MVWKELIETLADDFITYTMTVTVLFMVVTGAVVPEWIIGAYGLILAFYFKK